MILLQQRHRESIPCATTRYPRKWMIQYAAASRLHLGVSGILGRPVKPGDDSGV